MQRELAWRGVLVQRGFQRPSSTDLLEPITRHEARPHGADGFGNHSKPATNDSV